MLALRDAARDEGGFFSFLRRGQPKRALKDSELSAWVCRVLVRAMAAKAPVSVRYRPATAQTAEAFSLIPTELFGRGSDIYVEGMVSPAFELRELRVDRIFDARIDRPSPTENKGMRGALHELRPRREGAHDPGQYRASQGLYEQYSETAAAEGGHRALSIGISLLIVLGGVFGGFEFLRRYIGF
jgi:hypothetical protein